MAIKDAQLDDALSGGEWTLFAPNDDAMMDDMGLVWTDEVTKFHVVKGMTLMFDDDLKCTDKIETVNGQYSRTKCKGGDKYQTGIGNFALGAMPKIVEADILVCNGVIHGVDKVLLPNMKTLSAVISDNEDDDGLVSIVATSEVQKEAPPVLVNKLDVDAPWPLPEKCFSTNPQAAYVDRTEPLSFTTPQFGDPTSVNYPAAFNLTFDQGLLAGRYPNPLCWNGTIGMGEDPDQNCINSIKEVSGFAYLDTTDGSGKVDVSMNVHDLDMGELPYDKISSGRMRIVSTDFNAWTVEGKQTYQPFMRRTVDGRQRDFGGGVAGNILQHGCTAQGEPAFPRLNSRVSTWGHGDIYLDGVIKYKNLWMHMMYTNRYRDGTTNKIYANKTVDKVYDIHVCKESETANTEMEFSVIFARWCADSSTFPTRIANGTIVDQPKIHAASNLDFLFTFTGPEIRDENWQASVVPPVLNRTAFNVRNCEAGNTNPGYCDDTEALIEAALMTRGVALTEKNYTELSTYYAADSQIVQYMAREGNADIYNGPKECADMYSHQDPLGEVYTWTDQMYGPLRLFHKVGSGSTFPNIVIETQLYNPDYDMKQQLVVLAPLEAPFAAKQSEIKFVANKTSPVEMAYEAHHDAIASNNFTAIIDGYANSAEMYQYVQAANKTMHYNSPKQITAMFEALAEKNNGNPESSAIWDIKFMEEERLCWVVVGEGDTMIVDLLIFDGEYKIERQYPAIMMWNKN